MITTRGSADVVFCLDASASMKPLITGVSRHITDFLRALDSDKQVQWDWRLEFVAHSASNEDGDLLLRHESVLQDEVIDALYGREDSDGLIHGAREAAGRLWRKFRKEVPTEQDRQAVRHRVGPQSAFFTPSVSAFQKSLDRVACEGDEATLIALDTCLDLPWRPAPDCHRVVVLMTDERPEDGVASDMQRRALPGLIRKIEQLRVALHIIGPESGILDALAEADRSEYTVVDGGNEAVKAGDSWLARADFGKLLLQVGMSVTRSLMAPMAIPPQTADVPVQQALFGQYEWATRRSRLTGR